MREYSAYRHAGTGNTGWSGYAATAAAGYGATRRSAVTTRFARNVTALLLLATPLFIPAAVATQDAQPAASHQKLTFEGSTALWTVAIKPDKTADFEQIMKRVHEALLKSPDPQRRQQAAGWKVMRVSKPLADGNIAYVHIVDPVVSGADYTIMQTLYDAFPDERQALYQLYRGAFAQNLSLATGTIAVAAAGPSTNE